MTTRRIGCTLILSGTIALSGGPLRAQSGDDAVSHAQPMEETTSTSPRGPFDESDLDSASSARRLEGSWAVTLTPVPPPGVPPPPPVRVYATFGRGGAFIGSDRNRPFNSPQHGTWAYTGHGEFGYTFISDRFDAAGAFLGTVKVRVRELRLTDGDVFVGVSSGEVRDAAGNVVAIACGTIRGERIRVEPLPSQCEEIEPFS